MTIKELYEWCSDNHIEDSEITVMVIGDAIKVYSDISAEISMRKPYITGEYKDSVIINELVICCYDKKN